MDTWELSGFSELFLPNQGVRFVNVLGWEAARRITTETGNEKEKQTNLQFEPNHLLWC